jgi:hypothetical protein
VSACVVWRGLQLVARLRPDPQTPDAAWISLSGGEGYDYLIRVHSGEDAKSPFDHWAPTLAQALAFGDPYGVKPEDSRSHVSYGRVRHRQPVSGVISEYSPEAGSSAPSLVQSTNKAELSRRIALSRGMTENGTSCRIRYIWSG